MLKLFMYEASWYENAGPLKSPNVFKFNKTI